MKTTTTPALEALEAELAKQNEMQAAFERAMRELEDVQLAVPNAFLEELEELTTPRVPTTTSTMPFFGIRG